MVTPLISPLELICTVCLLPLVRSVRFAAKPEASTNTSILPPPAVPWRLPKIFRLASLQLPEMRSPWLVTSLLKQNLHCASDSYRFDLSNDVTSQGDRISGNWSEASRNIFGNLQGTAGGGRIDVFVEASGFAANLTLRTNGNKQTVQISSKGEIRGVTITMVKS